MSCPTSELNTFYRNLPILLHNPPHQLHNQSFKCQTLCNVVNRFPYEAIDQSTQSSSILPSMHPQIKDLQTRIAHYAVRPTTIGTLGKSQDNSMLHAFLQNQCTLRMMSACLPRLIEARNTVEGLLEEDSSGLYRRGWAKTP